MKYASQLQKLGFTENEAAVYLASLRVGNARVSSIANEAKLPKSTTSDTLETLLEKGLVSRYKHKNRFHFAAAKPDVLSTWVDRQKTLIDSLLPKLQSIQGKADREPTVRSYFDKRGFAVVEQEIIAEANEFLLITPAHDLDELAADYFPDFMIRRLKHNIRARILIEESPIANQVKALDSIAQHETRTLKPPLPFQSIMLIWKNKIATVSLRENVAIVIIEDKNISGMITSLFELLWNNVAK